jgi:DNA-binding transcriptional ArsR family regulator
MGRTRSRDQDLIDWLVAKIQQAGPSEATAQTNGHQKAASESPSGSTPTDEVVIEKCRASKNAAKFSALFDHGDVYAHHGGDDSRADLSLLGLLAFWTQDEGQLERIFSSSALGRREKWRRRDDYRKRTVAKALSDVGEIYKWPRERQRDRNEGGTSGTPLYSSATSATSRKLALVRFAGRPAPATRGFIVPDLIPRYHPTTLYGWGGTAKSLLALLLGMSVAGGREKFFGHDMAVHGPVLYIDFELDADEQHRRVMQLAEGMQMDVPEDLLYVCALGVRTQEAIDFALSMCKEHDVVLAVLDSLGPAMVGDMAAAKDVIEFHNHYIAPFKAIGVTPILVDHQARQQAGEGYQSKGAFGSAYKEHLSRSLIQVEAGDRSAEKGILNVRLRHKKTNFGALVEPFDVSLSFSDEMILATTRDLAPSERAQESTLNAADRVVAALEDGPAYPDELVEATGLVRGTVKNKITALKKAGRVETTGEIRSQMEQVRLVAPAARPYKGSAASAASDTSPATVADLFANPPDWLVGQLVRYREDSDRHFRPLCAYVAAVVLGDDAHWEEVKEDVLREVAPTTRRVHIPTERKAGRPYEEPDVAYIGREYRRGPYNFDASVWANPFTVEEHGRERAVELYREYILNTPELIARLGELRGKVLACWCKPDEDCHGDVLIELLSREE